MARKFTPHSLEVLKQKMEDAGGFVPYELPAKVNDDLKKVNFDFENWEDSPPGYCDCAGIMGFCTAPNGLPFLGVTAGGDWEYPLFFIIYWDGKKLRGYIPTDGNMWNTDSKEAYGNSEDDGLNMAKRWPANYAGYGETPTEQAQYIQSLESDDCPGNNQEQILADIVARITPRGSVPPVETETETETDMTINPVTGTQSPKLEL
jgi:hypothetical protein